MWDFTTVGLALVFVGFVAVAVSLLTSGGSASSDAKGAGVIMVGPIPLIFGSDAKWASVAVGLAIVLVLVGMLVHVL